MNAPIDLAALPRLALEDLRRLWSQHFARSPPPAQKRLLIRELAWRIQERAHGGLDVQTTGLLRSAIRSVQRERAADAGGGDNMGRKRRGSRSIAPRHPRAAADLQPGTRLIRLWRGRSHEVIVLDDGRSFRYLDQTYRSLTEVARVITGIHWSGPRFFGLVTRAKRSSRPQ